MKNPLPDSADVWGLDAFCRLPRAKSFVLVYLFLALTMVLAIVPLFRKISDFTMTLLASAPCILAIFFLQLEGSDLKNWFQRTFSWPAGKTAFFAGFAVVVLPILAAAAFHWYVTGFFPRLTALPFSGHIFGLFLYYLVNAFVEDIAWRAYLLPRALKLYPGMKTLLMLAVFWAFWHFPFHIVLGLMVPEDIPQQLIVYPAMFFSFLLVYSLSEGSLWPLTLAHALHNTFCTVFNRHFADIARVSDGWIFHDARFVLIVSLSFAAMLFRRGGSHFFSE
ncbi:MAG TPA: CPBP family intramembrane metalloprotease [Candidatus Rifleibacterium sp.]|nr:CPBP family intramembrane metalloprotease [Candidatus Rifleibacterium sp.]